MKNYILIFLQTENISIPTDTFPHSKAKIKVNFHTQNFINLNKVFKFLSAFTAFRFFSAGSPIRNWE